MKKSIQAYNIIRKLLFYIAPFIIVLIYKIDFFYSYEKAIISLLMLGFAYWKNTKSKELTSRILNLSYKTITILLFLFLALLAEMKFFD